MYIKKYYIFNINSIYIFLYRIYIAYDEIYNIWSLTFKECTALFYYIAYNKVNNKVNNNTIIIKTYIHFNNTTSQY